MPSELRFCRNCGFRLGEGLAEYTETVRFDGSHPQVVAASGEVLPPRKRRRKITGMTWIFIGLLAFFVCAAAFTAIVTPFRPHVQISVPVPPRSYVGVDGFDTTDGGVTFSYVEAPGVPADKAGLVGGDIITSFDGQTVTEDDQMMDLLRRTPIGKTVNITYMRDGEQFVTTLTTVSKEEYDGLVSAFRRRPEGAGRFGYDDDDSERVQIPGTQMYGVRLDNISPSLPADMAGIKKGDIVTEFDKVPIRTTRELRQRVLFAIPYKTIILKVFRDGQNLEIPVKMGRQS
jgi:S1-C subfamily serine protease